MRKTDTDFPTIFIQNHQGLGDMLVANAIFRHFAVTHNVLIPCKTHNLPSVQFMLKGLHVAFFSITNDEQAKRLADVSTKFGVRVLKLGMFADGTFDAQHWDRELYRVAGIPFEHRWSKWKVERDLSREFEPSNYPYAFLHDDLNRGFLLKNDLLPKELKLIHASDLETDNIFDYCRLIENATELHVIDSCFAILADSLPTLKAKRKVVHLYARANALPPTYKQDWEILK